MKTKIKHHCGQQDFPVYSCPTKPITTAEAMNILLDPNLDPARKLPNTVTKMRETAPPKLAARKLCQDVGDVTGASSASQLPRRHQWAADCQHMPTHGPNFAVTTKSAVMCKESEGKKRQEGQESELKKRSDVKPLGINAMTGSVLKAQPSRSTLSSHLLSRPVSSLDLLPTPDHSVRMSSSVVLPPTHSSSFLNVPSSTTVASGLGVCTSTPQPVDPPPLMQCAAPINALTSIAQVNILSPSSSVRSLCKQKRHSSGYDAKYFQQH